MKIISKVLLFLAFSGSCFNDRSSVTAEDVLEDPFPPKTARIVNGDRSNPLSRPFFAKAGYDEYYFTNEILCGATLIWSDILITAAHCQGAFNNGAVILDRETNDYTRLVQIDKQIRHPGWSISRQQLNHDVLVMRLATPLLSSDAAKPISINTNIHFPSNKQSLKAYGFGLTETQVVSNYLREAEVTYISNDECWGRGIKFNNVLKSDEVMCTDPFGDKTATCLGDSGGPLTDTTGSTLVGVISFGSGCEADQIPDGHVRLSEVSGWVQEQICLLSANPPDGCKPNIEEHDPRAVKVVIDFTHDFYPEHTTFSVRSKKTRETVYAGPEYIPTRNGNHKESFFLLPDEYYFEVYDVEGDGLESERGNGLWRISAFYDGCTDTEIANGGPSFKNQQVTAFVVSEGSISYNTNCAGEDYQKDTTSNESSTSDTSDSISEELDLCLHEKESEMAFGELFSTICECAPNASSGKIELGCVNDSLQPCAANYEACTLASDCCSGRRCVSGRCRSSAPTTNGRESKKIGDTTVGGAAARSARIPGNLRRR